MSNFKKPVKLFLEMNDVELNWAKISKTLPPKRRFANDRAPTMEELRKMTTYPDMRVEAIVLTMASSGIRVGAWNYLRLRDIKPIERDDKAIACRLTVYAGTQEQYLTFITPEAYASIHRYLKYREHHGEQLTPDTPLLRNTFNTSKPVNHWKGEAGNPAPLKHSGVKRLIERVLWRYGFRTEANGRLSESLSCCRRHPFRIIHAKTQVG